MDVWLWFTAETLSPRRVAHVITKLLFVACARAGLDLSRPQ